jgi:hypothetical protein
VQNRALAISMQMASERQFPKLMKCTTNIVPIHSRPAFMVQ